ncbi:MAG: sigma-70 family RNA polymerase sigma factor [Clostridium sp.]
MDNQERDNQVAHDQILRRQIIDSKKDPVILEELINTFMPLILKAANIYARGDVEDATSEGIEAFIKCVNKYPDDAKVPFPFYAKRGVYSHVRYYGSKEILKNENLLSLDSPLRGCTDITLKDTISSGEFTEDAFINKLNCLELITEIENLNYIERETIQRHYFLNHSLKKIALDTGYSYRGIKYAKQRGIDTLINLLNY